MTATAVMTSPFKSFRLIASEGVKIKSKQNLNQHALVQQEL